MNQPDYLWRNLEYTSVAGPEQRQPTRPVGYDLLVRGILLPYNVVIDDGVHGPEVFTLDTTWEGGQWLPFRINHSALVGVAEVFEDRVGLLIEGRISYPSRRRAAGKSWLSAAFASIESHRGRDGVLEHVACRLTDASLTDRPVAKPHTFATFSEADD